MNIIKKLRLEKKFTQTKLAKKCGLTASAICQFEKGLRKPSLRSLIGLSKVLEFEMDKLANAIEKKLEFEVK